MVEVLQLMTKLVMLMNNFKAAVNSKSNNTNKQTESKPCNLVMVQQRQQRNGEGKN